MKNYLIISLLILSVGFCQQKKTDEPNPYKGVRIKKIFEFTYQQKFDDYIEIPTNDSIVVTYNTLGLIIDSTNYIPPGNLSDYKDTESFEIFDKWFHGKFNNHYEYDTQGRLTKNISSHTYKDELESYHGYLYEYNKNGLKVKKTDFTIGERIESIWLFKYNSNNNLVNETKYSPNGELWKRNSRTLIDSFNLNYTASGESKIISKYDTKDRLIEKIGYKHNGNKLWVNKIEYDKLKKIETQTIVGTKNKTETIYNYDEKGNLLETKELRFKPFDHPSEAFKPSNKQGNVEYITTEIYKYDSKDRLIQKIKPENYKTSNISWWEYDYDDLGKLISIKKGTVDDKFEKINFIPNYKTVIEYGY